MKWTITEDEGEQTDSSLVPESMLGALFLAVDGVDGSETVRTCRSTRQSGHAGEARPAHTS